MRENSIIHIGVTVVAVAGENIGSNVGSDGNGRRRLRMMV